MPASGVRRQSFHSRRRSLLCFTPNFFVPLKPMSSDARVPQSVDSTVEAGRRAVAALAHFDLPTDRKCKCGEPQRARLQSRAFRRRVDDQNAFWQGQRRVYIHMWSRQAAVILARRRSGHPRDGTKLGTATWLVVARRTCTFRSVVRSECASAATSELGGRPRRWSPLIVVHGRHWTSDRAARRNLV